jgi:hypothetical protein
MISIQVECPLQIGQLDATFLHFHFATKEEFSSRSCTIRRSHRHRDISHVSRGYRIPAKQPALEEIIDPEGSDEVLFEVPLL